jgi:hypothetical protein
MELNELAWFCGLSIFGGLLGCAAASAHRLVASKPAKMLPSFVTVVSTLVILAMGICVLGYGFAVAGPLLHEDVRVRINMSNIGDLAVYVSLLGTYLTTIFGYFTIVAYGVGLVLCAILQRAGRRRAIPLPTTAG